MKMTLAHLKEGRAGRLTKRHKSSSIDLPAGLRFVVTTRIPEDRTSGITIIRTEKGSTLEMFWDFDNPEVEDIGTGSVEIKVTINEDARTGGVPAAAPLRRIPLKPEDYRRMLQNIGEHSPNMKLIDLANMLDKSVAWVLSRLWG